MSSIKCANIFSSEACATLFPADRADQFFDALFGDTSEGAYDIGLSFVGHDEGKDILQFNLNLVQRPGKCLACNLTYGLPEVFSRHPILNIAGLVGDIDTILEGQAKCGEWKLGSTKTISNDLHTIPLSIQLQR